MGRHPRRPGQRIAHRLREAAMRNLVIAADVMPPPACIVGGLMILLSKRGKRLGDLLAGTMVVREEFVPEAHPRASRWETSWVAGAERGRTRRSLTLADAKIDARQIQIIERFLARCDSLRALSGRPSPGESPSLSSRHGRGSGSPGQSAGPLRGLRAGTAIDQRSRQRGWPEPGVNADRGRGRCENPAMAGIRQADLRSP